MLNKQLNLWCDLLNSFFTNVSSTKEYYIFNENLLVVEYLITEFYISISLNSVSFIFSFITILLTLVSLLIDYNHENEHTSLYYILLTSTACLVVCSLTQDLFWFYLGFKSVTIPIYYLIHMYRSDIDKFKACDWYALFSFFSRAVLSLSVALLASQYRTTNISVLTTKFSSCFAVNSTIQHYIYISLLTAFLIKLPVAPFYIQLPEAHAETPTSSSILLSRSILKLRGYSIYKYFLPLFRNISYYNPIIYTIMYISILHSSLSAISTNHIKQIIAYSSIVHMNLRALSLLSNKTYGVTRGLYCMLSHNFISSGLSILAEILYNRYQTYYLKKYSSLFESTSTLALFFAFFTISNISTPLTGNFVGKFLTFIALIKQNPYIGFMVLFYVVVTTTYSLLLFMKVVYGGIKIWKVGSAELGLFKDTTVLKYNTSLFLVIVIIILSITPYHFLESLYIT